MSLQGLIVYIFLILNNNPLSECDLPIYLMKDTLVASKFR